jgi:hypothetical protein
MRSYRGYNVSDCAPCNVARPPVPTIGRSAITQLLRAQQRSRDALLTEIAVRRSQRWESLQRFDDSDGQDLQQMAVGILEVESAPATTMIDRHVVG